MRPPRPRAVSAAGPRPYPVVLLATILALFLALSACAGDSEPGATEEESPSASTSEAGETESAEESESESPSPAEEPYLPVPEGVELTAQGSPLEVGEPAVVAYEPRQDQVAALKIKVTRMVDADFDDFVGWKLSAETRKTSPYFVEATVKNVGDTDVGGTGVPLYAVDGTNKLIEASSFQSTFKPCSPEAFPNRFKNGDSGKFCLVYLAPDKGDLTAVSFRPVEEFDPITWTGKLQKSGSGGKKGGQQGGKNR